MEQINWATEHSEALREHLTRRISFSEDVKRINATFGTAYTRNAAIGRARRLRITGHERPNSLLPGKPAPLEKVHEPRSIESPLSRPHWPLPVFDKVAKTKLRCADVEPRHLTLVELESGDWRYPYGGEEENEAITFCGHPRRAGSSYCAPHFHLSRDPLAEGDAGATFLRIMESA